MDWKVFFSAFLTLFLAELGDKTQLAALALSASSRKPVSVLAGGILGIITVTILAVLAGEIFGSFVPRWAVRKGAAALFIAVGLYLWMRGVSYE